MKTLVLMTAALFIFTPIGQTQTPDPAGEDGPVWRFSEYRFDPGKRQEYTKSLREHLLPVLAEQKRQGLILDYKFFHNDTTSGMNETQHVEAILYRNFADALDYDLERGKKFQAIGLKHFGSPEVLRKANQHRATLRHFVRGYFLHEMTITPIAPAAPATQGAGGPR